jgi:hypothetical protein
MSPLRWDVLLLGLVLALPVLALGLRGDLSAEDVALRLPWCLAAAWASVALLRLAGTPRASAHRTASERGTGPARPAAPGPEDEHSSAG